MCANGEACHMVLLAKRTFEAAPKENKQACSKLEMGVTWHEGILGNVGVLGKDREKEKSHHPCDETNHTAKSKVLIKFKSLNINTNKENLNQCPSSTD